MPATMSILGLYQADSTIFNNMSVPVGMDKNSLIQEILAQCAEFEILYPDPKFIKTIISAWSKQSMYKWQKLFDTMSLNYDPISNYDRHEEWSDDTTITPGSSETIAQQGYENAGFVDASRSTRSGEDNSKAIRKGRAWGNIGVTTSQQMIKSEREDVAEFNIYQIIINDFKSRFCLCIY